MLFEGRYKTQDYLKPVNYLKLVMLTSPGFFKKEANLYKKKEKKKKKKKPRKYGFVNCHR